MSTHLPQHLGHAFLPSGNVAIVEPVAITDPAHIPTGAEPGEWGEMSRIEDPGGHVLRDLDADLDEPLVLDPPETIEEMSGPGDYNHLDTQYRAA